MLDFADLLIPSPPKLARIPTIGRPRPSKGKSDLPRPTKQHSIASRGPINRRPTGKGTSNAEGGNAPVLTRPKPKLVDKIVNRLSAKGNLIPHNKLVSL